MRAIRHALDALSARATTSDGRTVRPFNPAARQDRTLFEVLMSGEHELHGFTNRDLREHLARAGFPSHPRRGQALRTSDASLAPTPRPPVDCQDPSVTSLAGLSQWPPGHGRSDQTPQGRLPELIRRGCMTQSFAKRKDVAEEDSIRPLSIWEMFD